VEAPRLTAEDRVPTVAAMGSKAPPQAATKVTAQAAHQAAIGAALVYAGELLMKGRAVALTVESVTALRNLRAAQADENEHPQSAREERREGRRPLRHCDRGRRKRHRATATINGLLAVLDCYRCMLYGSANCSL